MVLMQYDKEFELSKMANNYQKSKMTNNDKKSYRTLSLLPRLTKMITLKYVLRSCGSRPFRGGVETQSLLLIPFLKIFLSFFF
jgi:hypothetical protein